MKNKILFPVSLFLLFSFFAIIMPAERQSDASADENLTSNNMFMNFHQFAAASHAEAKAVKTAAKVVEKKPTEKPAVEESVEKIKPIMQPKLAVGVIDSTDAEIKKLNAELEIINSLSENLVEEQLEIHEKSETEIALSKEQQKIFDSTWEQFETQQALIEISVNNMNRMFAEEDSIDLIIAIESEQKVETGSALEEVKENVEITSDSITIKNTVAEFEEQIKKEEELRAKAQKAIQAVNKKTAEDKIEQIKAENSIVEPTKVEVVKNTDTMTIGFNTQVIVESFGTPADVTAVNIVATPEIKVEKKQVVLEKLTLAREDGKLFLAFDDSCSLDGMRFVELTRPDSLDEEGRYALGHIELFKKNGKKIKSESYLESHQYGKYYPDKPESERWVPIPWNLGRTDGNLGDTLKTEENKLPLKEVFKE